MIATELRPEVRLLHTGGHATGRPFLGAEHLPALAHCRKQPLRLRFIRRADGHGKSIELRVPRATPIRRHQVRLPNSKARMHDLVFRARGLAARGRFRIIFEPHHHIHFRAERAAIKLERLLAAPVKE